MLVDYFMWEAEAIMGTDEAQRLQDEAVKKYGGIFSHYEVYEMPYDDSWGCEAACSTYYKRVVPEKV